MKTHAIQFQGITCSDEVLIELGRIAVSWAALDAFLDHVLEKLAGMDRYMDDRRTPLHAPRSFSQRLQNFGTYCSQLALEFPHLRNCQRVHEQLKNVYQLQNRHLNSRFVPGMDPMKRETCIADRPGSQTEQVEDLHRISEEINRAHEALYALVFRPGARSAQPCSFPA